MSPLRPKSAKSIAVAEWGRIASRVAHKFHRVEICGKKVEIQVTKGFKSMSLKWGCHSAEAAGYCIKWWQWMWGEPKIVFTQFTSQIGRSREKLHICTREKETLFLFKNGGSMNYLFGGGEWGGVYPSKISKADWRLPLWQDSLCFSAQSPSPLKPPPLMSWRHFPKNVFRVAANAAVAQMHLALHSSVQHPSASAGPLSKAYRYIAKYVELIGSTIFLLYCV